MSPVQSAQSVAYYAVDSIRSLARAPVDTAGIVIASTTALVGWAFGSANLLLLRIVGLAMLMDLLVGSMRAVVDPLQDFDIQKLYGGLLGKLFRSLLIPVASLIDWLYVASPLPLPDGYEKAFPITAFAMVALAAAEITSSLNKFKDGGVAPESIAVIIRQLDRIRLGTEPPRKRHYDPSAVAAEKERLRKPVTEKGRENE